MITSSLSFCILFLAYSEGDAFSHKHCGGDAFFGKDAGQDPKASGILAKTSPPVCRETVT